MRDLGIQIRDHRYERLGRWWAMAGRQPEGAAWALQFIDIVNKQLGQNKHPGATFQTLISNSATRNSVTSGLACHDMSREHGRAPETSKKKKTWHCGPARYGFFLNESSQLADSELQVNSTCHSFRPAKRYVLPSFRDRVLVIAICYGI
jgi:hypothetical protein